MDNTEKDGMEILNQVIESCKANIESNTETKASFEDFMNVYSELGQSVSTLINIIDETSAINQKENEEFKKTVSQIPKTITAELSRQSIEALRKSNLVLGNFRDDFSGFSDDSTKWQFCV